jgi:(S)-mandelate dehydrogenase
MFVGGQMDASLSWADVAWLRERWPHKLVLKGLATAGDALRAQAAGFDGIVMSNHGGRQLDSSVSPMEDLAAVRAAVGPGFTVIVDSGFRRGSDVVKAMALGANAVMVGRPVLYGVAAGGEAGALRALELLQADIGRVLGQLGVPSFEQLGLDAVRIEARR